MPRETIRRCLERRRTTKVTQLTPLHKGVTSSVWMVPSSSSMVATEPGKDGRVGTYTEVDTKSTV